VPVIGFLIWKVRLVEQTDRTIFSSLPKGQTTWDS
jgi:hypothetical protein